jgi:ribosomal protein S27AE
MGFKPPGKGGDAEMWKFRSCPRCGGDIFLDNEEHVWFEHCLQCGYIRELKSIAEFSRRVESTVPAGRRAGRKSKY